MKSFIVPALLMMSSLVFSQGIDSAQAAFTFHGQLLDSTTQKPIPFAHIALGSSVSVSNQSGYYSIRYHTGQTHSIVKLSCIGYQSKEVRLSYLLHSPEITLAQDITTLQGVVVSELTAKDILKRAEKNGARNYSTSKYMADYQFDQLVFFDGADSATAMSRELGLLTNRGLDTTGYYPQFTTTHTSVSPRFLEFDTVSNALTPLVNQGNTISVQTAYSFDPIRIGLLQQFHPVPTIFSKGFYENTDLNVLALVTLSEKDYYLIGVYPKEIKHTGAPTKEELQQMDAYKKHIQDMAARSGRSITDGLMDSIFSVNRKGKISTTHITGFFLVDVQTYGIVHTLIKLNTFDPTGRPFAKLHVSASYTLHEKRYYLQNLDILIKKTSPYTANQGTLYYLVSLSMSNFQKKKASFSSLSAQRVDSQKQNYDLKNLEQFLKPIKDCATCERNPLILFGQSFD